MAVGRGGVDTFALPNAAERKVLERKAFANAVAPKRNPNFKLKFNNFIYAPALKWGVGGRGRRYLLARCLMNDSILGHKKTERKLPIKISPAVLLFLSAFCLFPFLFGLLFGPRT